MKCEICGNEYTPKRGIRKYRACYREKCRKELQVRYNRDYYKRPEVKKKMQEYQKKYHKKYYQISEVKKSNRKSKRKYRQKHQNNPKYRLNNAISRGIYKSLRGNKNGRHWEDLVGYSLIELRKHLESQFTEGMTME